MGQYYKAICIDQKTDKKWAYSHDYNNGGLKLMEHSYIGNSFVGIVERLLSKGGDWHKKPFVWAGDYADIDEGQLLNLYGQCEINDYYKVGTDIKVLDKRYIVNHTKGEYVDKKKAPLYEEEDLTVHPLPLLTCEGNGRGGGDYRMKNVFIGVWSRDVISMEGRRPAKFVEIVPNFELDW